MRFLNIIKEFQQSRKVFMPTVCLSICLSAACARSYSLRHFLNVVKFIYVVHTSFRIYNVENSSYGAEGSSAETHIRAIPQ